MTAAERQKRRRTFAQDASEQTTELRRRALVREMVAGAILPGLLARKDAGVFDRAPNVLRLQGRTTTD